MITCPNCHKQPESFKRVVEPRGSDDIEATEEYDNRTGNSEFKILYLDDYEPQTHFECSICGGLVDPDDWERLYDEEEF